MYDKIDERLSELRNRSSANAGSGGGSDVAAGPGISAGHLLLTAKRKYTASHVIEELRSLFRKYNLSVSAIIFGIQRVYELQASKAPGLVHWYLDKSDIGAKGSEFCEDVLDLLTECGFVPGSVSDAALVESGRSKDTLVWTLASGTWRRSSLQRVSKARISSMVINCNPSGRTEVLKDARFEFSSEDDQHNCCFRCTLL